MNCSILNCSASCIRALDIAFLVDCSASPDESAWNTTITAVYSLLAKFDVSATGTRYSVIHYSDAAIRYPNTDGRMPSPVIIGRDDGQICGGGGHNVLSALRKARREFFTTREYKHPWATGERLAVPDVVVIIALGPSSDAGAAAVAVAEADLLKADGTTIVTVGVGPGVNVAELAAISSNDTQADEFVVDEVGDLDGLIPALVDAICGFSVEGMLKFLTGFYPLSESKHY